MAVKLGYFTNSETSLHSRNDENAARYRGLRANTRPLVALSYQVIDFTGCYSVLNTPSEGGKSAHNGSKRKAKEGIRCGKIGVSQAIHIPNLRQAIGLKSRSFSQSKISKSIEKSSAAGKVSARPQHVHGGVMSSTTSEIRKIKLELDKLRAQFIKAGDQEERDLIQRRINYHLRTLEMLEG